MTRDTCRLRRDDGFTVFEMAVVMVIFAVVVTVTLNIMTDVQRQTSDNLRRADAVAQGRLGLSYMDRQLRNAEDIHVAPVAVPMNLRAYIREAGGAERCVEYRVTAASAPGVTPVTDGRLEMRQWATVGEAATAPWRPLAIGLVNSRTSTAAFTQPPNFAKPIVNIELLVKPARGNQQVDAPGEGGEPVRLVTSLSARNPRPAGPPGPANLCQQVTPFP